VLADLIEAEGGCCPFLDFTVHREEDEIGSRSASPRRQGPVPSCRSSRAWAAQRGRRPPGHADPGGVLKSAGLPSPRWLASQDKCPLSRLGHEGTRSEAAHANAQLGVSTGAPRPAAFVDLAPRRISADLTAEIRGEKSWSHQGVLAIRVGVYWLAAKSPHDHGFQSCRQSILLTHGCEGDRSRHRRSRFRYPSRRSFA
jgi:hypothetical protein